MENKDTSLNTTTGYIVKPLVCDECSREFLTSEDAGNHAMSEKHYSFKIKGTTMGLGFI